MISISRKEKHYQQRKTISIGGKENNFQQANEIFKASSNDKHNLYEEEFETQKSRKLTSAKRIVYENHTLNTQESKMKMRKESKFCKKHYQ